MRLAFSDFGKENKIFALELKFGIDSLSPGGTGQTYILEHKMIAVKYK